MGLKQKTERTEFIGNNKRRKIRRNNFISMRFNQKAEKETPIGSFWCKTEHVYWNETCSALAFLLYYGGKNLILFAETEGILKRIIWTKKITNFADHRLFEKLIVAHLFKKLSDVTEPEVSLNSWQGPVTFETLRNVLWHADHSP